jgi:hypothetical protein
MPSDPDECGPFCERALFWNCVVCERRRRLLGFSYQRLIALRRCKRWARPISRARSRAWRHQPRRRAGRGHERAALAAEATFAGPARLCQGGILARRLAAPYASREAARSRGCARLDRARVCLVMDVAARWAAVSSGERPRTKRSACGTPGTLLSGDPHGTSGRKAGPVGFVDAAQTASYAESTLGETAVRAHA